MHRANRLRREALQAIAAALSRCYVLGRYPEAVFPHLFALLRSASNLSPILAERLERGRSIRSGPWLRLAGGSELGTALIRVFERHPGPVESCDISPDGRFVVSATSTEARTLGALWDAETGQLLETFRGPFRPLCRFSPDGRYAAFGPWLCDVEARRMHSALTGHRIRDLAWSPNGGLIATVGDPDGSVVLWQTEVHPVSEAAARRAAPLVAHLPREYQDEELVPLRKHRVVRTLQLPEAFEAHSFRGARVAFSPEGTYLAGANGKSLAVWDTTSFEAQLEVRATDSNPSCCFSPDGRRFFWASEGQPRWWETESWTELPFPVNPDFGSRLLFDHVFTADGSGLLAGQDAGLVQYLELQGAPRMTRRRLHGTTLHACRMSPDRRFLLTASDDRTAKLWHGEPARLLGGDQTDSPIGGCCFSPDGRNVLDSNGRLWDPGTGREIGSLPEPEDESGMSAFAFTPDGQLLSGHADLTIRSWDLQRRAELARIRLPGEAGEIISAVSPDGTRAISSGRGTARLWDLLTLQELMALPGQTGAFSPDGLLMAVNVYGSGEAGDTIKVWDARTGENIAVLGGYETSPHLLVFSPDGATLASANGWSVKLWRLSDGSESLSVRHQDQIGGIAFHPSGRWILSAGEDDKLLLWEAGSGRVIAFLYGLSGGWRSCAFSPDGETVVAGDGVGRLLFFRLEGIDTAEPHGAAAEGVEGVRR